MTMIGNLSNLGTVGWFYYEEEGVEYGRTMGKRRILKSMHTARYSAEETFSDPQY